MSDDIPQDLVDKMMVKCARRCCICRRFRPIKLQVHHIRERSRGGGNDEGNLIVTCISCHSDVHSKVPFARRFSEEELKGHRDGLIRLVSEGKLPLEDHDDTDMAIAQVVTRLASAVKTTGELLPEAMTLLLSAVQAKEDDQGVIVVIKSGPHLHIQVANQGFTGGGDARADAKYKKGLNQLLSAGLLTQVSEVLHEVTYEGYLMADELVSSGGDHPT
jgi:hypothetical protein